MKPAPARRRPNLVPTLEDREFLPAALEILETPPSPVRMMVVWVMAGFVTVALIWSYFGRLDVIAIAQGKVQPPGRVKVVQPNEPGNEARKVQPPGRVKVVQPTETGKVARIAVQNGDRVQKDDVLVAFDPKDAQADLESLEASVNALRAEIARRDALIGVLSKTPDGAMRAPAVPFPEGIPEATRQRENEVMRADLSQLAAALGSLEAQRVQKQRERQRLIDTATAQEGLVKTQRERVTMRGSLAVSGFGTRTALIDAREALQKEETALATYKGQLSEAEAALDVLARERTRQFQTLTTEYTQKRTDAQRALDEASQKLVKARTRFENLTLRAPENGVVQALALYTVGQVVSAGQEVMRIVPESATMEVEAYVPNKDIGFVREGHAVSVKIDSFPYTRYGMIDGRVTRVAYDAIPQPEASQIEANPARPGESQGFAGAQRTQNLVFPVTITLERKHLMIAGQPVPITPGMTVVAEIKTGSRRILEYVFAPVYEVTSESLRER